MPRNESVTKETFGTDAKNPKLHKGRFDIVGHMIDDASPLPARGTPAGSTNVKTGWPANEK